MATRRYKIAKWFVIANYLFIPFSFVLAIASMIGAFTFWRDAELATSAVVLLFSIGWIAGGLYSIRILPGMKETIQISDEKIIQEHSDGTLTAISWKEGFKVKNHPFLGRLDVISMDGEKIIRIEQQLKMYREVVEFIEMKYQER